MALICPSCGSDNVYQKVHQFLWINDDSAKPWTVDLGVFCDDCDWHSEDANELIDTDAQGPWEACPYYFEEGGVGDCPFHLECVNTNQFCERRFRSDPYQ